MTNLTTDNAGELLQPIFDGLAVQIKEQVTGLLGASDARLEKLEKAVPAEAPALEIDLTDADAVQALADSLKKETKVDLTDRASVEAHLATMEKSSDKDEKDLEIEKLKRDLAKAQSTSNLRDTHSDLIDGSGDLYESDDDFISDLNSDMQEA